MIHWCWRCGYRYDPDSIMFGDICPNCGVNQKLRKNPHKPKIPKEKPRFFNVRITGIATDNDKREES